MKPGFHPKVENKFRFRDVLWKPTLRVQDSGARIVELHRLDGPLCLDDSAKLESQDPNHSSKAKCPICEREYDLHLPINPFKELAQKAYQAAQDSELKTISLDSPIQPIKDRAEDDQHWVEVKMGHTSDGRKIAQILVGDKKRTDKVQLFIDLDNEQFRGDRADAKPWEVIAKVEAEFLNSKHRIKKK